jgi:hypothetical protein
MVKKLLFLLLLCVPLFLTAEEPPELIELVRDDLEIAAWDSLYKDLLAPKTSWRLDNRLYLEEDAFRGLHTLLMKRGGQTLLLNYTRDWEAPTDHVNIQAEITSDQLVRQAVFGHYRVRFGRGLAIGNGQRGIPREVFTLGKPASPESVSPFGSAAKLKWLRFTFLGFGSVRDRQANLSAAGITSLPTSHTDADGTVLESMFGAGIAYDSKVLRLGGLWYKQVYDQDFADPDLDPGLSVRSLYGAIEVPAHKIDAEAVLAGHNSQQHISWQYSHAGFVQSISFTANPDLKNISYSTPAAILSRDTHTNELAWDASFPLQKALRLRLRYALNYNERQSFSFRTSKSRLAAVLDYHSKLNSATLSVFNFDREILVPIDGSYTVTLPRNWRAELKFRQIVFPGLNYEFQFRYHLEDKSEFDQNSFYFANGFSYRNRNLSLGIGYKSWKNFRQYLYYEDATPEAYNSAQRDDSVLDLSAALKLWKVNAGLNYRVSLTGDTPQRLILRVGMAL